MSAYRKDAGLVRLAFHLGPWRSPRSRGWQDAYNALVSALSDTKVPIYGVLEADLAGGRIGSQRWCKRFAANATEVIAQFGDRIPTFEVLPGPNLPGPDGAPRLSEAVYARVLAEAYGAIKADPRVRPVILVSGAVALYNDGAGYLARVISAGAALPAGTVSSGMPADIPFDAIAAWPALPHDLGPIPAAPLNGQLEALAQALIPFPAVGALPVYVSGMTWKMRSQGDYDGADIAAALLDLQDIRPQVCIAVRAAAESGPVFVRSEPAEYPESFAFAVFAEPSWPARRAVRGETPSIDGFDFPVGSRDKLEPQQAGYVITTYLADPGYYNNPKFKGAWHPGEDWAAWGPHDTGLGDPIYAIADGVVVFRQYCSPSWGRIILIRHTLRNGGYVWSQYAHLDSWLVEENQIVQRGLQIGTLGKGANNAFCAHLHFEIRNGDLKPDTWFPLVRNKASVLANYLSPNNFIKTHRPTAFPDRRGVIIDNEPRQQASGAFARAETPGHWFRSYLGWNDTADVTYASKFETDWGEWRPRLPAAGRYEVQAWIPSHHATTHNAVYAIHHTGGVTTQAIDQAAHFDEWVSLGSYEFGTEGALVRLTDKTGEPDKKRLEVCFDAIRWLPA